MFLSMTACAVVNVNNIYIAKAIRNFVKRGRNKSAHIMLSGCPKDLMEHLMEHRPSDLRRVFAGRWESRARADRSALRLPADPRPSSAACAAPRRRDRTAKR